MNINQIIRRYAIPLGTAGGSVSKFDRKPMLDEIARLRRSREISYWLCVSLTIAGLILSAMFIIAERNHPVAIGALQAATGVSVVTLTTIATRLWQSKVKADLIIALASALPEDTLQSTLIRLIDAF